MRCTERDKVQPKSVTDSDQSQFLRSRVLRSQCLRRTVGSRELHCNVSLVSRVDTKNNTAGLCTKHLDGLRTQSLVRKLGLLILEGTNDTEGDG